MSTIHKRIWFAQGQLAQVRITARTRSQTGFTVFHPADSQGRLFTHARTKAEALAVLLAKLRTTERLRFSVKPAKAGDLEALIRAGVEIGLPEALCRKAVRGP